MNYFWRAAASAESLRAFNTFMYRAVGAQWFATLEPVTFRLNRIFRHPWQLAPDPSFQLHPSLPPHHHLVTEKTPVTTPQLHQSGSLALLSLSQPSPGPHGQYLHQAAGRRRVIPSTSVTPATPESLAPPPRGHCLATGWQPPPQDGRKISTDGAEPSRGEALPLHPLAWQ